MGKFAAEAGFGVILSSYVIEHHIGGADWRDNAAHRLRWVRSTRRSRPLGYIGQLFTMPLPLALLVCAADPAWWPAAMAAITLSHGVSLGHLARVRGRGSTGCCCRWKTWSRFCSGSRDFSETPSSGADAATGCTPTAGLSWLSDARAGDCGYCAGRTVSTLFASTWLKLHRETGGAVVRAPLILVVARQAPGRIRRS